MWANHGDDISFQYAGTGALKSGFTRTGVRTKAGLVDDGVKSGKRYFLNNFQDGHKQDAIDLITGNYIVQKGTDSITESMYYMESKRPKFSLFSISVLHLSGSLS